MQKQNIHPIFPKLNTKWICAILAVAMVAGAAGKIHHYDSDVIYKNTPTTASQLANKHVYINSHISQSVLNTMKEYQQHHYGDNITSKMTVQTNDGKIIHILTSNGLSEKSIELDKELTSKRTWDSLTNFYKQHDGIHLTEGGTQTLMMSNKDGVINAEQFQGYFKEAIQKHNANAEKNDTLEIYSGQKVQGQKPIIQYLGSFKSTTEFNPDSGQIENFAVLYTKAPLDSKEIQLLRQQIVNHASTIKYNASMTAYSKNDHNTTELMYGTTNQQWTYTAPSGPT